MNIKIKTSRWTDDYSFEELMMREAAILSVRKRKNVKPFTLPVILEATVGKRTLFFNTYFLLLDAGMPDEAETMRIKMLQQYQVDITREPSYSKP
jgi:hypothetical protein